MSGRAPTDVEISRALNALATTLGDQRPASFDVRRFQEIVDGALAHERKLEVVHEGANAGHVARADDRRRIATVSLTAGRWSVERQVDAKGSSWAVPQPEAASA